MPRTVILGAAGFIGSHLADRFIARGHEVVGIDNLSTGTLANLRHLDGEPRFVLVEQDITSGVKLDGAVQNVLNMASPASPYDYLRLPLATLDAGSLGTRSALLFAREKGARFLQASTSEVYGDPLEHPQTESYCGNVDPIGVRSVYDESKRFAEALVSAFRRTTGLDSRIARIFNTYGPRMRLNDGRVVPAFVAQVLEARPLTVFGSGSQTRSFCYIDDMVDGIEALLGSREHRPVNLGNPEEHTILEFASTIQALAGSDLPIHHLDLPEGDPKVRRPDISRATAVLGWRPKIPLREGLERMLAWYRPRLSAGRCERPSGPPTRSASSEP